MTFLIWQGICLLAIQGIHTVWGKTEQFQALKLGQIGGFRSVFLFVCLFLAKHLLIRKLSYKCYYIHLYGGFFNLKQFKQTYNANPRVIND